MSKLRRHYSIREVELEGTVRQIRSAQLSSRTTTDDVEMNAAYVINNEEGYATQEDKNSESAYQNAEDILTTSEHEAVSHFKRNVGFTDTERRDQNTEEAAYQLNVRTAKKRQSANFSYPGLLS